MGPFDQYAGAPPMGGYGYNLSPGNYGAPMVGTSFGRIPFPQSPYAMMAGPSQPYQPLAMYQPPPPPQFFPNVESLGPMGNMMLQTVGQAGLQFLGINPAGVSLGAYNPVTTARHQIAAAGMAMSMGLSSPAARTETERGLGSLFNKFGTAMHGGETGLRAQAEQEVAKRFKGEEKEKFDRLQKDLKTYADDEARVKLTQASITNMLDKPATAQVAAYKKELSGRATEDASKFAKLLYDPGAGGQMARASLMALGNTPLGEGLQVGAMEQMFLGNSMYQGVQALAGPAGMSGEATERLTTGVLKHFRNGKDFLDPTMTRGLRATELGDLAGQLSRRGLVSGDFTGGDATSREAARLKALRDTMAKYTPIIDELGEIFTANKGDVDKLMSGLEDMTAGMSQTLSEGRVRSVIREVRKTAALTGMSTEAVAQITGQAAQTALSQGFMAETGFAAAQMGLRMQEDIRLSSMSTGRGPYQGQRSQMQMASDMMQLGIRGVASKTGNVVGGALSSLEIAAMTAGVETEGKSQLEIFDQVMKAQGKTTDTPEVARSRELIAAIESGKNPELLLRASHNMENTGNDLGAALDLARVTVVDQLYNPTQRTEGFANKYMNQIGGAQVAELYEKLSPEVAAKIRSATGRDMDATAIMKAALEGDDVSVKGQIDSISGEMRRQGMDAKEARSYAAQVQSYISAGGASAAFRTAAGPDGYAQGLASFINVRTNPTQLALARGRQMLVDSTLDIEEMTKEGGQGVASAAQELARSLVDADEDKVAETIRKIGLRVDPDVQAQLKKTVGNLRSNLDDYETSIGIIRKDASPEDRAAAEDAARATLAKNTEADTAALKEFLTKSMSPEAIKEVAKETEAAAGKGKGDLDDGGKPKEPIARLTGTTKIVLEGDGWRDRGTLTVGMEDEAVV